MAEYISATQNITYEGVTLRAEAISIYGFLVIVWIFRVIIAIVNPCPPDANVWMAYGQFIGSLIIMSLLLVPFIKVKKHSIESIKSGKNKY